METVHEVSRPWVVRDCDCDGRCNICDGHGWYYLHMGTGQTLSEMMRSAFERHG